ncbi:MAG TPA: M15 family metallopeptidase [Polyangia bacterium]
MNALGLGVLIFLAGGGVFHGSQGPIPAPLATRMRQHSWREGCPTPIADLVYLRLSHYGYDGAVHEGELVVHKALGIEVLAIFKVLFMQHFPVEKMRVIDDYQGDDDASMADNNTSAFNCRFVAGRPGVFSRHSSGRAIDLNPRTNPMIMGGSIFPAAGAEFAGRRKKVPGMLRPGARAVAEFTRRGWTWGGGWASMKDYQHFEK